MVRPSRLSLSCVVVALAACGPTIVRDSGSTVVYEPVRHALAPAALPSAPAAFVGPVEVRQGESIVRYEPVLGDDAPDPASPAAPIEDDGEAADSPALPGGRANTPVAPGAFGVHLTADGLAFPYPIAHFFRGFGPCRGRRHQ